MRTMLVGLPVLMVAAALESSVLPDLRTPGGGGLNLVLLLTLSWTLSGDWNGGLVWGLLGGLFLDLLSGGPLGIHSLALVATAYVASLTEGQLWRSHILLPLAAALFGSLVFQLLALTGLAVSGVAIDVAIALTGVVLPSTLLNTLFILPVYAIMRRVHALVYPAPVKSA
ncbi:MAG: rod shape-determining protein MreD [Anaerolineales bacterium]|nr:rod shape-determining protein MreD [Anaerolineales bacterium]